MIGRVVLTVGSRFVLTALSLVSSIVTARVLGEEGRGNYFFMVTLSGTIVQFANLGVPASAFFYTARDRRTGPGFVANALWVSVVVGGGSGVALALIAHWAGELQDTPVTFLLLAAGLAVPSLFFLIVANVIAGMERFVAFNSVESGSRALAVVAILVAGVLSVGANGFVLAAIVAWSVAAVISGGVALRGMRMRLGFDLKLFSLGLRYSTKIYVVTLFGFVVLRSNVFLLRREFGPAEVGLYSIAAQMADVLLIVPNAISFVLFPRLVRATHSRWQSTFRAGVTTAVSMTLLCGLAALLAGPIIRLLYGPEFAPAAAVLRLMLPGIVCLGVGSVLSAYLTSRRVPRLVVAIWFGAALLAIGLSFALVPEHAGAGAATALSLTYGALLAALFLAAIRERSRTDDSADEIRTIVADSGEMPPGSE
jgi:antigen flippase